MSTAKTDEILGPVSYASGGFVVSTGLASLNFFSLETKIPGANLPPCHFEYSLNTPAAGQATVKIVRHQYSRTPSLGSVSSLPAGVTAQSSSNQTYDVESVHTHNMDHNHGAVTSSTNTLAGGGTTLDLTGPINISSHTHSFDVPNFTGNTSAVTSSFTIDSSSFGMHGTLIGSTLPTIVAGDTGFGNAIQFNGTQIDYENTSGVLVGSNEFEFTGSNSFTVECKFKRNGALASSIAGLVTRWQDDTDTLANWVIEVDSATDFLVAGARRTGVSSAVFGSTAIGTSWHHTEMAYDGTNNTLRLWLDGIFEGSVVVTGGLSNPSDAVKTWIGRFDYSSGQLPFNGIIDEVRISNIARHTTDADYTPPAAPYSSDANTIGLWHFESSIAGHTHNWNNIYQHSHSVTQVQTNEAVSEMPNLTDLSGTTFYYMAIE